MDKPNIVMQQIQLPKGVKGQFNDIFKGEEMWENDVPNRSNMGDELAAMMGTGASARVQPA